MALVNSCFNFLCHTFPSLRGLACVALVPWPCLLAVVGTSAWVSGGSPICSYAPSSGAESPQAPSCARRVEPPVSQPFQHSLSQKGFQRFPFPSSSSPTPQPRTGVWGSCCCPRLVQITPECASSEQVLTSADTISTLLSVPLGTGGLSLVWCGLCCRGQCGGVSGGCCVTGITCS